MGRKCVFEHPDNQLGLQDQLGLAEEVKACGVQILFTQQMDDSVLCIEHEAAASPMKYGRKRLRRAELHQDLSSLMVQEKELCHVQP